MLEDKVFGCYEVGLLYAAVYLHGQVEMHVQNCGAPRNAVMLLKSWWWAVFPHDLWGPTYCNPKVPGFGIIIVVLKVDGFAVRAFTTLRDDTRLWESEYVNMKDETLSKVWLFFLIDIGLV